MTNFSHYPFQQAIYQALTANSVLMGLVTGVYDRAPQGTSYPFITIGEFSGSDWSTRTTSGMVYIFTVHIWSQQGGRKESASIMAAIHSTLHQVTLSVTGQTLVMMRFSDSNIVLEGDGFTYHGAMKFQAFLEAN